jgi:hypothetical protein
MRHVALAATSWCDKCLPPQGPPPLPNLLATWHMPMGPWRQARVSWAHGGTCHMSPGQPAATQEVVLFAKFIEKWFFNIWLAHVVLFCSTGQCRCAAATALVLFGDLLPWHDTTRHDVAWCNNSAPRQDSHLRAQGFNHSWYSWGCYSLLA